MDCRHPEDLKHPTSESVMPGLHHRTFLLGYDIGSSSVKAALVDAESKELMHVTTAPTGQAMPILSPQPGFGEQDPQMWWEHLCTATKKLLKETKVDPSSILAIGIAYQMHGLVCIDQNKRPLRPAIIWCDSRAIETGNTAFAEMGEERCLRHLLNAPGNFTAAKFKWVKDNEPHVYGQTKHILLPGDYIAMRLTGEVNTTPMGLSEGMFWDFHKNAVADFLLEHFQFSNDCIAPIVPALGFQGTVTAFAAEETGLRKGIPVTYRGGDQPNNAYSLGVLHPGEIAASGGTSGVIYGISDTLEADAAQKVNHFMHVNHTKEMPRIGVLLCINGAGSLYQWVKESIAGQQTFAEMEKETETTETGANGLTFLPFGNGAERMLNNALIGSHLLHLDFHRHQKAHIYRAALEGIAFAFVYGMEHLRTLGVNLTQIRAADDNLFQSRIFCTAISELTGSRISIFHTTGASGAACAAGVGCGVFATPEEGIFPAATIRTVEPAEKDNYHEAYDRWISDLKMLL